MPRSVDRLPLQVTHDPTQSLEYHVRLGLTKGTELWQLILDAIREHAEDLVRKLLQQLMQLPATVDQALDELYALLPDWVTELPDKIVAFINANAGINLGSWNAFLASLSDGKGIDLPALPKIVAALDGIPWQSGDPGAILRAILAAGMTLVRNILPSWLPQIPLTSIGNTSPNLLSEGDFADPITVDTNTGFYWDGDHGRGVPVLPPGCAAVDPDGSDLVLVSEIVPVSEGQKVEAGFFVTYEGVTAGADSVRAELKTYLDGVDVSTVVLESLAPSGTNSTWLLKLSGEETIPAGVDGVAVQIHVTSAATAGTVRFDDAFVRKLQKLPIPFVDQLDSVLDAAKDRVQSIIDRIINAFENLGEFVDQVLPVEGVLEAIFGIFDVGLGARTKAAAIEARVRQLESAANAILLDFAGSSSSSPGDGWSITSSGGGGGSMGRDGKGNLVWKPSGAGNRTQIGVYTAGELSVDNGRVEWILASSPQSYVFDDAYTYVVFRAKDTSNYVRVRSGWNTIRLQAVVGGVVSNIGPQWSGFPKAGDQFTCDFGESGDVNKRHFVLSRNGTPVIDFTDTVSQVGAEFRRVGAGMETGNRLVLFQNIPAGLGVVVASEVL